jgi:hypothetical protein
VNKQGWPSPPTHLLGAGADVPAADQSAAGRGAREYAANAGAHNLQGAHWVNHTQCITKVAGLHRVSVGQAWALQHASLPHFRLATAHHPSPAGTPPLGRLSCRRSCAPWTLWQQQASNQVRAAMDVMRDRCRDASRCKSSSSLMLRYCGHQGWRKEAEASDLSHLCCDTAQSHHTGSQPAPTWS